MMDFTYPSSTYAAWSEFHRSAREIGQAVLMSGVPAAATANGLVALNLGRVAMVRMVPKDGE